MGLQATLAVIDTEDDRCSLSKKHGMREMRSEKLSDLITCSLCSGGLKPTLSKRRACAPSSCKIKRNSVAFKNSTNHEDFLFFGIGIERFSVTTPRIGCSLRGSMLDASSSKLVYARYQLS